MKAYQIALLYLLLVTFSLFPFMNQVNDLEQLGMNDSLNVSVNVILQDGNVIFTPTDTLGMKGFKPEGK